MTEHDAYESAYRNGERKGFQNGLDAADAYLLNGGANVSNAKLFGLSDSVKASKYPMSVDIDSIDRSVTNRVRALAKSERGAGHDQWLTGCVVQFDLTLSIKAWVEAERYHFFDFVSSQSTMHRIARFDIKKCCNDYVDDRTIAVAQEYADTYNELNERLKNAATDEERAALSLECKEAYLRLLYNIPVGFQLTARMTTNYRQLKTIYAQRVNHRLPEWRDFCHWLETLPFSDFITCKDEEAEEVDRLGTDYIHW